MKPAKSQSKRLGINANLAYADDVSFESSYLLLLKCGCSAHADNRGPSRGRSPIWPGTGTLPRPRPRFVRNRGFSPVPVPDLAGTGTLPRPRFPSGGPRPARDSTLSERRGASRPSRGTGIQAALGHHAQRASAAACPLASRGQRRGRGPVGADTVPQRAKQYPSRGLDLGC